MAMLTTNQAAHRLGVKVETLYAYVSRGLLRSHRSPDGRTSAFDNREVEALARRGRPRQSSQARSLDIAIETSITAIADHRLAYRGYDAVDLSRTATFEQVAELLWSGVLPARPPHWRGTVYDAAAERMGDRIRIIAAAAAAAERDATGSIDRDTVMAQGRALIASIVDSLPIAGHGRRPQLVLRDGTVVRDSIAGRLWARLTTRRATPELMATLNASLVLLADHELAASTLAARVAASTRARPHAVVAAGLGTLSGPLHGGESRRARAVLADATASGVDAAIANAMERHGRLPGFGQMLYPDGDPRARALLEMLGDGVSTPVLDTAERLQAEAARRGEPPANVDFALAVLGAATGMAPDGGEAIFSAARIAGWLAHAMEEYREQPLRFRPRAIYVG